MVKNTLRPFAPKGLLTNNQTNQLKRWFDGENRVINQRDLAEKIGISRNKLYQSFKKNPDRPFDELQLKNLNKLISIYNEDILLEKEVEESTDRVTDKAQRLAINLIKKVGK